MGQFLPNGLSTTASHLEKEIVVGTERRSNLYESQTSFSSEYIDQQTKTYLILSKEVYQKEFARSDYCHQATTSLHNEETEDEVPTEPR